MHTYIDNTT